ncbi:ABC transporter G family member 10 [Hibiscus syriacus]|uniref:ABC transporter G family member 10 n=1 Tax=Hibiscus syriacus TaxID=106335 RepID=A0A6A3B757_HIBSY|nr:ABC transporter G family member 10 [Hibiscus syriacus]
MELLVKSSVPGGRKPPYRLETRNLSFKLSTPFEDYFRWIFCGGRNRYRPAKFILKGVDCEARPGQITAIAGLSGAGKTTLLEILAGKIPPCEVSSGEVLVNGKPIDVKHFRRVSGYVTQDDALFPLLTVEETLMYSALLRLPGGRKEAGSRVKGLLKELGLEHVAGSRIGYGSSNGISGGERWRVSIGVDLVHDPVVILIDEPTSGLDSASALHAVTLLKSMALNQGKTIVLTIHQPGFRILELFDRIVLLSNGFVVHNGELNLLEGRLKHTNQHKPCSHSNKEPDRSRTKAYRLPQFPIRRSPDIRPKILQQHLQNQATLRNKSYTSLDRLLRLHAHFPTIFHHRGTTNFLTRTKNPNARDIKRSLQSFLLRLSQHHRFPSISFTGRAPLHFAGLWLVFLRRDSVDGFLYFSLVVWMVLLMSNSFVACFSALVPNFIIGNSVIAGLMGSFFLFSGYFIAKDKIPDYWVFMHYLSLFKYPFECFMVNEFGGEQGEKKCIEVENGECSLFGSWFLSQQDLKDSQKWTNLAVMLGFIVGYRVLCLLILWYRCYRARN